MFRYLYDYLLKKVSLSENSIKEIHLLNQIDWCSNVGNIDENISTPYKITWCTQEEALYYLSFDTDKDGITSVENLFLLTSNILSGYLVKHHHHLYNTEWNKVVDEINKHANYERISLKQKIFNEKFHSNVNLRLENYIRLYGLMSYFYEKDHNLPRLFFFEVLKVYTSGHLIVGWKGNKPLSNSGSLLIF